MPRSYRCIIVALVGWLSLAAANPPTENKQQETKTAKGEPPPPPFRPHPNLNEDTCYYAKDHDAADLCAQWRAANAAEKAARETQRATTWSIVGTILSGLALGALLWTLRQTERALTHARQVSEPI